MNTSDDPRIRFGLSCPSDGKFYICQDSPTRFIGCCRVDPCTPEYEGKCPSSELFAASFSSASGVHFLPQSCVSPYNSSIWYTCDHTRPPFLGCCTNNPCNSNGCSTGHLFAARLSDDPENANQFLLPENTTDPSVTGTSIVPVGTGSPSPSPSPSPDSTAGGGERAGTIAGIAVAGVVILLLVIAAYLWIKRRKNAQEKRKREEVYRDIPSVNALQSNDIYQVASPIQGGVLLTPNSNRFSYDPRSNMPSPSISENFNNSHHLSQLSELEGSSGMIRALQPNLGEAYRGFNGRES